MGLITWLKKLRKIPVIRPVSNRHNKAVNALGSGLCYGENFTAGRPVLENLKVRGYCYRDGITGMK
jgi:hypothetical protein